MRTLGEKFSHFREAEQVDRISLVEARARDINERIICINGVQSDLYLQDEDARARYWARHRTHTACMKCMDGRMHLPSITKTPTGIVKPLRAIGGRFEVFWPALRFRMDAFVDSAISHGGRNLVLGTYHFSKSHKELGCAGWSCDTASARAHVTRFCTELGDIYQAQMTTIVTGVETDTDELILHGPRGDVRGSALIGLSDDQIFRVVRECFPTMHETVVVDLIPFLAGNALRVQELNEHPRTLAELGHSERIIAVGQGFNWLAEANQALIVNDMDPNLDQAIITQARIIQGNLASASKGDDATLFACMPYHKPGRDRRDAVAAARGLLRFAQDHIRARCPDLWKSGRLHHLVGVVEEHSKKLEVLEDSIRR